MVSSHLVGLFEQYHIGAGTYIQELLLICGLVHPYTPPCQIIQIAGRWVREGRCNAVWVLAFIACCKSANKTSYSRICVVLQASKSIFFQSAFILFVLVIRNTNGSLSTWEISVSPALVFTKGQRLAMSKVKILTPKCCGLASRVWLSRLDRFLWRWWTQQQGWQWPVQEDQTLQTQEVISKLFCCQIFKLGTSAVHVSYQCWLQKSLMRGGSTIFLYLQILPAKCRTKEFMCGLSSAKAWKFVKTWARKL